jgi:enamine deaminase RidA (YjgF/YER057c/UK114 family)
MPLSRNRFVALPAVPARRTRRRTLGHRFCARKRQRRRQRENAQQCGIRPLPALRPDRSVGAIAAGPAVLDHITPAGIRPPFARYSHAVEVPAGCRVLFCSGQLGIAADDAVPEGVEAQAELCFRGIAAILAAAGMTMADLVRINAYVSGREHLAGYMRVRDRFVADPPPASTLMIVSGFARPEFLVEVEVVAARHAAP